MLNDALTTALVVTLVVACVLAAYFGVRYLLMKRSLRAMNRELLAVREGLKENRVVKLPQPDKDIEALLITINGLLEDLRTNARDYARREADFKAQIEYVSHDLRTPLTSLQGYLSFIDSTALSTEDRESLETVAKKADALERLVVQFYELSRLEDDEGALDLRAHDVARILRETMTEHYRLLSERGLEVSLSIPEHPVEATVDPGALERVYANLLQNAGRYATTYLRVTMKREDEQVSIVFANDVHDMESEEAERLFLPFYRQDSSRTSFKQDSSRVSFKQENSLTNNQDHTSRQDGSRVSFKQNDSRTHYKQDSSLTYNRQESSRAYEGSGLGLTIARRLTERMGGHLKAQIDSQGEEQTISFTFSIGC